MIIPTRCMTCGIPISGKYKKYKELVLKYQNIDNLAQHPPLRKADDSILKSKTAEEKAFVELNIKKYCCRRMFLCNVEILQDIS